MTDLSNFKSWQSDWQSLRVIVYGLGLSGFAAADTLRQLGAEVLVITESADEKHIDLCEVIGAKVVLASGFDSVPKDAVEFSADLLVTSPGVKPEAALLRWAQEEQIDIFTEVDLAWRLRDRSGRASKWICITGTNGKTTTTGLVTKILRAAGINAVACGNIGLPVLDAVCSPANYEVLVVELSSFQLHYLTHIEPEASVVLNIADDHLDWHGSLEAYEAAKSKVYDHTKIACVINSRDRATQRALERSVDNADAQLVGFSLLVPAPNEIGWVEDLLVDRAYIEDPNEALELAQVADLVRIPVKSPHLLENIAAAAALVRALGVSPEFIAAGLREFELDAHRIQVVGEHDEVVYVNDSKATNPHAAAASLAAFESVVWVVGGLLKGVSLDDLIAKNAAKLRAAVVIGVDQSEVVAAIAANAPLCQVIQVEASGDVMASAVFAANQLAKSGDTVLLAPAAASMDQFKDYADRGYQFARAVHNLISSDN
jgi:UDP-N-acetylmuramoylalanine--D-glutamate ligase